MFGPFVGAFERFLKGHGVCGYQISTTSTPQLPFKIPYIPTNRDHKALKGGTLGGLDRGAVQQPLVHRSSHWFLELGICELIVGNTHTGSCICRSLPRM